MRRAQRLAANLPPQWDRRVRELGKVLLDYRGARATALRGPLFSVLGRFSPLLAARLGRATVIVDSHDDEVGRTIFVTGDYERRYMDAALTFLRTSEPSREIGPTFVDVGANIGTSTLDALLEFGFERAICFEPDPHNYRLLRLNLVLNELEDRVTTFPLALSDASGERALARSARNSGDSHLVADLERQPGRDQVVEVRTLDELVSEGTLKPESVGVLWIDAQGHEPYILAGARHSLDAGFPVVAEYWPHGLGESGLELLERLVAELFTSVIDLRRMGEVESELAAAELGRLRAKYRRREFTDLLLLR